MSDSAKRVVITGANKGIGLATVAAVLDTDPTTFVFLGARNADRGEAALASLFAEHPEREGRVEVLHIDVSDDASVAAAAAHVRSRFPDEPHPLYGLVNNAGIGFGSNDMATVLDVNTYGPHRVFEAFAPLLDPQAARVVHISSGAAPMFLSGCSDEVVKRLTNPEVTWEDVDAAARRCLAIAAEGGDFSAAGFGSGDPYGLSKALLNALTIAQAREHADWTINACTPGFIETDLTRPFAENRGVSPEEMGMLSPEQGTRAPLRLLLGDPGGTGWYFGSDAERSPMDRYRSPGDPPYTGD